MVIESYEIESLRLNMEEKILTKEFRTLKLMEETARKENDVLLPRSKSAAENCLKIRENNFSKNPEFALEYLKKLHEYENNEYVRNVIKTDNIQITVFTSFWRCK